MNPESSKPIANAGRMQGVVLLAQIALTLIFAAVLLVESATAQQVYVVTSNQQFGVVDLGTGSFRQIGGTTPEGQANLVWGPQGVLYSLTFSAELEKIDPGTGATTIVGPTGLGPNFFDLAGVRGQLFATDLSNNIYSVDARTGGTTLMTATGMPPDQAYPLTFNADGTLNLCDESLYGIGGRLYAIFDSFTLDPATLAINPTTAAGLYQIDPASGLATYVGPTEMNLGAMVAVGAKVYAFKWVTTSFTDLGPQVRTEVMSLDLKTGATSFVSNVDPAAGGIVGAAPVLGRR